MDWEVFDKKKIHNGSRRKTTEPRIGIQASGQFSLNEAAFEALGEPEAVVLLFSRAEKTVGFRAASPTYPNVYPVRCYAGSSRTSARLVSGRMFLRHYGVDHSEARSYDASMSEACCAYRSGKAAPRALVVAACAPSPSR